MNAGLAGTRATTPPENLASRATGEVRLHSKFYLQHIDIQKIYKARVSGRVRQVGPPAPRPQISSPANSYTRTPLVSRRSRVAGLPLLNRQTRGATASTLQPMDSNSWSGTSTRPIPRPSRYSRNGTGSSGE